MHLKIDSDLWKIIIGALCFVGSLCLKQFEVISIILSILAYLVVGLEVYQSFFHHLSIKNIFDEKLLMIIATLGAFAIGEYQEAVAVMLFYQLGEYIGDKAVERSRNNIISLLSLKSEVVRIIRDDELISIEPNAVKVGDHIVVKPGERVPVDGKVLKGKGYIDTVMLTGESLPSFVEKGTEILSGSVVVDQVLTIQATKVVAESTVSKILNLIEHASNKKAKTEQFMTRFARIYTPIVFGLAILLCIIPTFVLHLSFDTWFYRSLTFLVVSCPCALVISIPLGFFCGIGISSHRGILVKGSESLERLAGLDTIIFDKTGTLTKGVFEVDKIHTQNSFTQDEILKYAAHAEFYSNHPIALSITKKYGKKVNRKDISDLQELSGYGIAMKYQDKQIILGNDRLMEKYNISYVPSKEIGTVIHIAVDKTYAGYLVIRDQIKEDAKLAIHTLYHNGIRDIILLSGDRKQIVDEVSSELKISKSFSQLLPQDKVNKVEHIMKEHDSKHFVAFVGDGMNDAPSLMMADVGISMGGIGSDAAIEASDVVIMNDQLMKINEGIMIGRRTKKIVWQNIIFAIGVKVLILLLGSLGMTAIWTAVFADVGVTILAILNALRIWRVKD